MELYRQVRAVAWAYQLDSFTEAALKDARIPIDEAITLMSARILDAKVLDKATIAKRIEEMELLSLAITDALTIQLTTSSGMIGSTATREWSQNLSIAGIATGVNMVALSPEQFKEFFITHPPMDLPIPSVIKNAWNDAVLNPVKKEMTQILQRGALMGDGYKSIVDSLEIASDAFNRNELTTMARTFFQHANAQAFQRVLDENNDVIKGKIWTTANDDSICLLCLALSERVFKKNEVHPPMPRHPRCRCVFRAKTVTYRELGININELDEVLKPVVMRGYTEDGKYHVPAINTGGNATIQSLSFYKGGIREAFPYLSVNQQQSILGLARYVLYKDKKLTIDNLIELPSGRLRLLKELM